MNGIGANLKKLFDSYAGLEKQIQQLVHPLSLYYCTACAGRCCREEICKESIESTFLSVLVEKQAVRYNRKKGWLRAEGCGLAYGRPLVCYQFFCEEVNNSTLYKTSRLQTIIQDFVSLGNRAYGNIHLLCIADLDILSAKKIEKLCYNASRIQKKIAAIRARSGIMGSG